MKILYWKTRPLRLSPAGGRRIHWPGLALNLALALVLVAVPVCGLVLIDLEFNLGESLPLWLLALPIVLTLGIALTAVGLGYRLTVPVDRLPGEHGEPPAQRTTRWFHWANLREVLFGLLASITVLLLARTLSDWQGRRAWEAYRADAEKRGVVFDLEKLMPPPVPDAENFAATPLLRPFQSGNPEFDRYRADHQNKVPDAPISLMDTSSKVPYPAEHNDFLGHRTDLALWQSYFRGSTNWPQWPEPRTAEQDVLKALSRWDGEIAELHSAAARPKTRFNMRLTEDGVSTLLTHLSCLKVASATVRLRAKAEIKSGQTDAAFADANLVFRLGDALQTEPVLISHLVRIAIHTLALRTVWEGLADHRWADAQLAHWQEELVKRNFAAELRHAMAGERAFGNLAIEFIRRRPEMLDSLGSVGDGESSSGTTPFGRQLAQLTPRGWLWAEQIHYNQMFDDYFVSALPAGPGLFNAALMQERRGAMEGDFQRHASGVRSMLRHRVIARMLLPALTGVMPKACRAQAFTQLAITACALERHRLARGSYPESLAALAPEFGPLPPDPMSAQPFHYERTADGRFRLWSVGWNGKDDGGTVALTGTPASKSRNINFEQGDWVWPVPQSQ